MIDFEAEQRRAEQYRDISRSAFAIFVFSLALVASFALLMFAGGDDMWRIQ